MYRLILKPLYWLFSKLAMNKLRLFVAILLLRKEKEIMAIVYATLIIKGRKTLEQVPAILKDQVKAILEDLEVPV